MRTAAPSMSPPGSARRPAAVRNFLNTPRNRGSLILPIADSTTPECDNYILCANIPGMEYHLGAVLATFPRGGAGSFLPVPADIPRRKVASQEVATITVTRERLEFIRLTLQPMTSAARTQVRGRSLSGSGQCLHGDPVKRQPRKHRMGQLVLEGGEERPEDRPAPIEPPEQKIDDHPAQERKNRHRMVQHPFQQTQQSPDAARQGQQGHHGTRPVQPTDQPVDGSGHLADSPVEDGTPNVGQATSLACTSGDACATPQRWLIRGHVSG